MSMWANDELDVRIVEVAGSSPVTSTEKSSSDPIAHLCLDRYAPRRDSMCSLAEANRCADLAADSTRCGAPAESREVVYDDHQLQPLLQTIGR